MDGEPIPKAPSRNGYEGPFNVPVEEQLVSRFGRRSSENGNQPLHTRAMQKLSKTTAL